jgi:OOP family OmpA-OmpF porin
MKKQLLTICLLATFFSAFAQNGDKYFKDKDYQRAAFAFEREAPTNPSLYLNLAKSYFALQEFDKAVLAMQLYKEKDPKADKVYADKYIALLQRDDEKVKVENMGPPINTSSDDYIPRILQDGKTLYFDSNRPGGSGGEDIWYSTLDASGNWSAPVALYGLNSSSHEGLLAISPDEKVAIVFGNYNGSFGGGDLFYSVKTTDGWTPPCNIGGTINTKKWESLACIGSDGKTLLYSTDVGDGNGSDIYLTFLSENGWSKPYSLGSTINTKSDEKYPFLSADGKTLYFSSDGHFGFGLNDMFMSRRLDDSWTKWSEPVNLGKYINTLDNDADLSIPASGKVAYIVKTDAPDGYGGRDIYKFLMPYSMRPEQLFKLYGYVFNEKDSVAEVNIKFIDMETNKEVTKATSSIENGYYSASLPLNKKYLAVIDMKGFLYYSEIIDLTDPDKYRKRYSFQQKITVQRKRLDELKLKLDELNVKLDGLNRTTSDKIRETFDLYERLTKDYKSAIEEMDKLVYQAKYDWMTENEEDLSLQKDFHVKRAKIGATFELKNIFFELGSAILKEDSKKELDKLVEIMKNSEIVIELGGHTDSIGSDEANLNLSQQRVESVKTYLVEKGISTKRLVAVGYGEKVPIAPNATAEGRQLNRRVEVKILKLQVDKEGSDIVTDADKKKKDKEPEVVVVKKGEMLPILQAAARKGGLPSGSDCNTETYKPKYVYTPTYNNKKKTTYFGKYFDMEKEGLDINDNVLKRVNISLVNFEYSALGKQSQGGDLTFVRKNKLHENHFQYYFSNPDMVKLGVGYDHLHMIQLKPKTGLPINLIWGLDFKYFMKDDTIQNKQTDYYHFNVPVGLRIIFPVKGIILGPEAFYSFGILRNKDNGVNSIPNMDNTTFLKIGATARWKFLHAGIYANAGKEISYLGYRLGVSF